MTAAVATGAIPIDVDPALADAVVLLRPPPGYRAAVEPLYERTGDDRRRAFEAKHLALFRSAGYLAPIERALGDAPELAAGVSGAFVARADDGRDEVVDLAREARGPGFRLGVRLRPSRFLDAPALEAHIRRELELVSEMLDPSFGYDPNALRGHAALDEARRERFALLWSIHAAGRLARRSGAHAPPAAAGFPAASSTDRERLLATAYPRVPAALRGEVLERLASPAPRTHGELIAMAEGPAALLDGLGIPRAEETPGPAPGGQCPLCAFPTHAWAATPLPAAVERAVRAGHPDWVPRDGLCGRCAERYAS